MREDFILAKLPSSWMMWLRNAWHHHNVIAVMGQASIVLRSPVTDCPPSLLSLPTLASHKLWMLIRKIRTLHFESVAHRVGTLSCFSSLCVFWFAGLNSAYIRAVVSSQLSPCCCSVHSHFLSDQTYPLSINFRVAPVASSSSTTTLVPAMLTPFSPVWSTNVLGSSTTLSVWVVQRLGLSLAKGGPGSQWGVRRWVPLSSHVTDSSQP